MGLGFFLKHAIILKTILKYYQLYFVCLGVPYSEHSNFQELCRFINFVKADKVIPTVPMSNRDMYRFLKKIVDSYKSRLRQQNIEQFMIK